MTSLRETLFPGLKRLRKRQTPSELEFLISERIDAINPEWWDAIAEPHSVFLSRPYLSMLEANSPSQLSMRYALLSRRGQPVAALAMQKVRLESARMQPIPDADNSFGAKLKRGARKLATEPLDDRQLLVLGNLLTYGQHGFARHPLLAAETFWHGAAEAIYRIRRAEKLEGGADLQLVKDLVGDDISHSQSMLDFGYRELETEPNMMLALDPAWQSYADYLASLASKYRKNAQSRILKPFEDERFRIGVIANPEAAAQRLHELYLAVHQAQDFRPFTLPESYWRELPATLGRRVRVIGIWELERLIGFVLMLADIDGTVFAYHIGFDKDAATRVPVYLRLLHAAIGEAIAMGGRRMSLGRTALEPKAALGAKPERMVVWARHRQPVLNKLVRGLLAHIDHDEAPERNPFKETPAPTSGKKTAAPKAAEE